MKTLPFPTGSIGAMLYNDPAPTRNTTIAIPREFSEGKAGFVREDSSDERRMHAAMAATVILAIALVAWLAI